MPQRCVGALARHRRTAGAVAPDAPVFRSAAGTALDAHNVRRSFRRVVQAAELDLAEWTPREMRQLRVSAEHISRLVGYSGTAVTESVYRQQLRPALQEGATAMDAIFPVSAEERITRIVTQRADDLADDRPASLRPGWS